MIIAIDGPSGSGKGTLSKRLCRELGLDHLDTGLLYRAVGYLSLQKNIDLSDEAAVTEIAKSLDAEIFQNPELRSDQSAVAASKVSVLPQVRQALLEYQRQFATPPYQGGKGAVLDGRDIGTVICPNAHLKIYLTASLEARAERRFKELQSRGISCTMGGVLKDMEARDLRDQQRDTAPLKPAEDAIVLDTSALDEEAVYETVLDLVQKI